MQHKRKQSLSSNGYCKVLKRLYKELLQVSSKALFLIILHSNGAEEGIFSMIAKNNTKHRACLDYSRFFNSIMLIQTNKPEHVLDCDH